MKKKEGNLLIQATCIFVMFVLYIMVMYVFSLYSLSSESDIVNDSLTSSCLAAFKNIDLNELGADPSAKVLIITDQNAALQTYKRHLKYNLSLNDDFSPKNPSGFIKSKVEIKSFIIYNVKGNDVTICELDPATNTFSSNVVIGGKGNVTTPKGNKVEATTIESKISMKVTQLFSLTKDLISIEDVDVTKR